MEEYVIDTNVLLVASAQHPGSPFEDSNVPAEQQLIALDWLIAFQKDTRRQFVIDELWKIWHEYCNKMTGQDFGLLVLSEKLQSSKVRFVDVSYDENGYGCLPPELERIVHDRSDRKFVAAALCNGGRSTIINAVDTDWCDWEKALSQAGITVIHLIEGLCKDRGRTRAKR